MKDKQLYGKDLIKSVSKNGIICTDCTFYLHMGFEDKRMKVNQKPVVDELHIRRSNNDKTIID